LAGAETAQAIFPNYFIDVVHMATLPSLHGVALGQISCQELCPGGLLFMTRNSGTP
jgi:hypothetical protein